MLFGGHSRPGTAPGTPKGADQEEEGDSLRVEAEALAKEVTFGRRPDMAAEVNEVTTGRRLDRAATEGSVSGALSRGVSWQRSVSELDVEPEISVKISHSVRDVSCSLEKVERVWVKAVGPTHIVQAAQAACPRSWIFDEENWEW